MSSFRLTRRAALRGAAGATIALPWLEIMSREAHAQSAPKRYVFAFMGSSLGGDGDPLPNLFVPDKQGPGYDLKPGLEPLGKAGVSEDVMVVSGLKLPSGGDAGYTGSWHAAAQATLFTGRRNGSSSAPVGTSADELLADTPVFKGKTKFQTLRLLVQPKGYAPGPYRVRDSLCYRDSNKLTMQSSPKAAYDSLFFDLPSKMADPQVAAARDYQLRTRRSVLDLVRSSHERLMKRVGRYDTQRLQKHLDEIRDLERRLVDVPSVMGASCAAPVPFAEPSVGKDAQKKPEGGVIVGGNAAWSDEDKRAVLMTEILAMALACDLTRIGALMYTMCQSYMSVEHIAGYKSDVHQVGHGGAGRPTTQKVTQVVAWHVKHFAALVKRLKEVPEGEGSVLDSCALVFSPEGGGGNTSHTGDNWACLVAGRAGGLKAGQHIAVAGKHPCAVMITAMNAVGAPIDRFGNVTGALPDLRS